MGAQVGAEGAGMNTNRLWEALAEEGRGFSFFQAVRLLESLLPDRDPVGGPGGPEDEVVRFSAHPSIAFPPNDIDALDLEEGGPARMSVNFMGLIGPQGVMPLDYTVLVAQRARERDTAMRDFLDIFQHRLISLFYRAWLKHRFLAQRERGEQDTVTTHLLDVAGLGLEGQQTIQDLDVEALAGYSGLMSAQPRSAQALEQLVSDYFGVPATVEQFIGDWYPLRVQDQTEIGDEIGMSSRLGLGALPGDEVWDPQARVRVRLGPLDRDQFDDFLPGGTAHASLQKLLLFFSHGEHEFEVQLALDEDEVPGLVLGSQENERLGWTTWLRTRRPERPADQTIFRIDEKGF